MATRDFSVSAKIDKGAHIARFALSIGADDYIGEYGIEDARTHRGDVFNHINFLAYIESALALHARIRADMVSAARADDAQVAGRDREISHKFDTTTEVAENSAVLKINVEMSLVNSSFADVLTIRCARVVRDSDSEYARVREELRDVRAALRETQDSLREVRESCARNIAIIKFCTYPAVGAIGIPARGRDFYTELIARFIAGGPILLPIIGPDFVRVGNEYFQWELHSRDIAICNIVCCYYPQCANAPFIASRGIVHSAERATWMVGTSAYSMAVIGNAHGPHRARYWAMNSRFGAKGYTRATWRDSERAYFGVAFASPLWVYQRADDPAATASEPITREFAAACAATEHLVILARASGMISLGVAQ